MARLTLDRRAQPGYSGPTMPPKPKPTPADPLGAVVSVTTPPLPRAQVETLIGEIDKTLAMVRTFWIEARDDNERAKSMKRINELLDKRLELIAARDAGPRTDVETGA